MLHGQVRVRSLACIELLELLDATAEVEVDVEVVVVDDGERVCHTRSTFLAAGGRVTRAISTQGPPLLRAAQGYSCITGVPFVEVTLRLDGDVLLCFGFPQLALPRMVPLLDRMRRDLADPELTGLQLA